MSSKYLSQSFWQSHDLESFGAVKDKGELSQLSHALSHLAGPVLFKTSGSSGNSKWVVHTRSSLLSSAQSVIDHLEIEKQDVWYLALPINHVGGFGVLARAYLAESKVVEHEGKWNPEQAVKKICDEKVSLISFVPAQVVDIVNADLRCPSSVRAVIVGGGALDSVIRGKAVQLGWPILLSYGMSETGSQIATQRDGLGSEMELIKSWEVNSSESGCLQVKGGGLFAGYLVQNDAGWHLDDPKKSGWFTTKDHVELSSSGLLFKRRGDRHVKILGELVDLAELESRLSLLMKAEVLLVDQEDARRGVVLLPIMERACYNQQLWQSINLTGLERLEAIQLCDHFPRNSMGKLDRLKLRDSVVFFDK